MEGQIYVGTEAVPADGLLGVLKGDQTFLYHPVLGDVVLSEETSQRAVTYFLLDMFEEFEELDDKAITSLTTLATGMRVFPHESGGYVITNLRKRHTAVVPYPGAPGYFLRPRGDLIQFTPTAWLAEASISSLDTHAALFEVGADPVQTFGAITRSPLSPVLIGSARLSKDASKSLVDAYLALHNSVTEAIAADATLFLRLNVIDVLTVSAEGARRSFGFIPFDECLGAHASGALSLAEGIILQLLLDADDLARDTYKRMLTDFSDDMALCAAETVTLPVPVVSAALRVFNQTMRIISAASWIIDDNIIGAYDATVNLAYAEVPGKDPSITLMACTTPSGQDNPCLIWFLTRICAPFRALGASQGNGIGR